jgi:hypothetical protein
MKFLRTVADYRRTKHISNQTLKQKPKFIIPDKIDDIK